MFRRFGLSRYAVTGILVVLLGCSSDDKGTNDNDEQPLSEASIGPEGGQIAASGLVSLNLPAGALADTTEFTISRNTSPPALAASDIFVSTVYSIDPAGTTFLQPGTVTVYYDQSLLAGADESSIQVCSHSGAGWQFHQSLIDENANSASAQISHLTLFGAKVKKVTTGTGDLADMAACTENCLQFYGAFWDNLFHILRYVDYRADPPVGIEYSRASGFFRFWVDLDEDELDDIEVTGQIVPTGPAVLYDWKCIQYSGETCVDSVYVPIDTIPPSEIGDGLHQNEVVIVSWQADDDPSAAAHIIGAGALSVRMLDHDRYWLTVAQENRLYVGDSCIFDISSLGCSRDLDDVFNETSHYASHYYRCGSWDSTQSPPVCDLWIEVSHPHPDSLEYYHIDSTFVWPSGTMEFISRKKWFSDSLYCLLVFQNGDPTGSISGSFGSESVEWTIDWRSFEID